MRFRSTDHAAKAYAWWVREGRGAIPSIDVGERVVRPVAGVCACGSPTVHVRRDHTYCCGSCGAAWRSEELIEGVGGPRRSSRAPRAKLMDLYALLASFYSRLLLWDRRALLLWGELLLDLDREKWVRQAQGDGARLRGLALDVPVLAEDERPLAALTRRLTDRFPRIIGGWDEGRARAYLRGGRRGLEEQLVRAEMIGGE